MKRVLWILITPALVILILGIALDQLFAPRILSFVTTKLESYSKGQGPFEIKIDSAKLQYFPPGIRATSVRLTPKETFARMMSDIEIQEIKAEFAFFSLITGKLKIGLIEIDSPVMQINVPIKGDSGNPQSFKIPADWSPIFKALRNVPVEQLRVTNLNLKIHEPKNQFTLLLYPTEFQVLYLPDYLKAKLSVPALIASWDKKERVKTEIHATAELTPNSLEIENLDIKNSTLNFSLSGQARSRAKKELEANFHWEGHLNLDEFRDSLHQILPKKKLPHLTGELKARGAWNPRKKSLLQAQFDLETKHVNIGNFTVGDASVKGTLDEADIHLEKIKIEHPAGNLELNNTKLGLGPNLPVSAKLNIATLDLQKLFQALNLKKIPVEAKITGKAPCEGQILPLQFSCQFDAKLNDLQVRAGYPRSSFEIVALEKADAKGVVNIDLNEVNFKSDLSLGSSKGATQGKVEYKKGFDIHFQASELHWDEVKNLSNLNLEGMSELTGHTKGNSNTANLKLQAKTKNHSLDKFFLGDTDLNLAYENGNIIINNIEGRVDKTRYAGEVSIDLKEDQIKGELKSSQAHLQDIRNILIKRIPIPVTLEGNGPVQVKVAGPLDFWGLTTVVKGQFQQPQIASEIFNHLTIDISSQDGLYSLNKVQAVRGATKLYIGGTLSPQQELQLSGALQNALLEESDIISKIGWPLSGKLNAEIKLEGTVNNPQLNMSGQFSEMILDENEVSNSSFKFQIQDHYATGEGAFFGHKIQSRIGWPLKAKAQGATSIRIKTQDWDYSPWLSLFNAGAINQETRGNLTCDVDLSSASGHWDQFSGRITIQNFMITRHDLILENPNPISITAQNGHYNIQNFLLKGEEKERVEIMGHNVHPTALNLEINASSDLKLAQIFVPVFEEISGPITFNSTIRGPWNRPELVGQMSINNGYFRLKGFPHAFEKMRLAATFSQNRILFNSIQGQLGGGTLKGEGSLQIQGPEDVPIMIRLRAQDISLNVPNQVKTKGDADLTFSGKWFPYLLSGTYRINSTVVEMGFGGTNLAQQMRKNYYLPQSLKEKIISPVELDLQLQFDRPLQIKNNLLEAQATGQLAVKGNPEQPVLVGELKSLKGSRLFFKDKPFEIQSATIQFQNPTEINPDLFINAQTRVDEYDINLLVQGEAKDPTIRLSSTPPLSENDITSLLALGVTSSKLETVQSKEQQAQTANEVFAAAFQSTGLTKKVQSATGFNVQLSNTFDTTRNISVPKFTVSRKLNKNTSASVAFPVTGDQKTPEGRIQYNFNENISINGSYETKKFDTSTTNIEVRETPSILGIDLEFKREFR